MMRIRFSEIANNELADACDWYEQQQDGLGHVSRVPCEMPRARLPGHRYCFQSSWKIYGALRYESVSLYLALRAARGGGLVRGGFAPTSPPGLLGRASQ